MRSGAFLRPSDRLFFHDTKIDNTMILSFKRTFPWSDPTYFSKKIAGDWGIPGIKSHTFRKGDRWKPGNKIHFWEESPRNPGSHPTPFNLSDPRSAVYWHDVQADKVIHRDLMPRLYNHCPAKHEDFVPLVFAIEIFVLTIWKSTNGFDEYFTLSIGDQKILEMMPIDMIHEYQNHDFRLAFRSMAYRDGFDNAFDFIRWFYRYKGKEGRLRLRGQVIHWNNQTIYDPIHANFFNPSN